MPRDDLYHLAHAHRAAMLDFAQRLIQTPSPSGEEGAVAALVTREMEALGYDTVRTDAVGNVIGMVRGAGGRSLMFNAHMDHVAPGDVALWPHPPYAGEIADGCLWGRAASDVKGTLAAQLYALGALHRAGLTPPGDRLMTAVVMEEIGGLGTQRLLEQVHPDYAVVGEATDNQLALGHRGRMALVVRVQGRSVHASAPSRGVNPHFAVARFLLALEQMPMATQPPFGTSTVAPTLCGTDQASNNVIPGEVWLHLDWRNVPQETPDDIVARLSALLEQSLIPESRGSVALNRRRLRTYTGLEVEFPELFPSFALPIDHPLAQSAQQALQSAYGRPVEARIWNFATDGGHLMAAGVPTIGFAPGSERHCHTVQDRIGVEELVEGMVGYMALALELR